MRLDFALETNNRYSSCLLMKVEAGLWENGSESREMKGSFFSSYLFNISFVGRMAAEMIVMGLGYVLLPRFACLLYF